MITSCKPKSIEVKRTYTNPVGEEPIFMGDPFAWRANEKYYLIGTTSPQEGFKCYESDDLVNWKLKGWAWQKTDSSWAQPPYWAPEVREYNGKYYLTYSGLKPGTANQLRMVLAVSDIPEGTYKDLYAPWFDLGYSTIDGDIFIDDDGKPYLYFSKNGSKDGYAYGINYVVKIKKDFSGIEGEPILVSQADQPWELVKPEENRCNEGAMVFKENSKYFMTYAGGNTSWPMYGVGYCTADNPMGPWLKAEENPILIKEIKIGVSGPGHNSIVKSPDGKEMFIVYHTHANINNPSEERVVNIDRIVITDSGKLKVIGPTRTPQPMPSGVK